MRPIYVVIGISIVIVGVLVASFASVIIVHYNNISDSFPANYPPLVSVFIWLNPIVTIGLSMIGYGLLSSSEVVRGRSHRSLRVDTIDGYSEKGSKSIITDFHNGQKK